MINKENQPLKTYDLVSLVMLVGLSLWFVGTVAWDSIGNKNVAAAKYDAESLALQLLSAQYNWKNPETYTGEGRGPATAEGPYLGFEGELGKDPWGQKFQYKVLQEPKGGLKYIVVWSPGPNTKSDTRIEDIDSTYVGKSTSLFRGDDVGVIRSVSN